MAAVEESGTSGRSLPLPSFAGAKVTAVDRISPSVLTGPLVDVDEPNDNDADTVDSSFLPSQPSTADVNASAEREQESEKTSRPERKLDPSLAPSHLNAALKHFKVDIESHVQGQYEASEGITAGAAFMRPLSDPCSGTVVHTPLHRSSSNPNLSGTKSVKKEWCDRLQASAGWTLKDDSTTESPMILHQSAIEGENNGSESSSIDCPVFKEKQASEPEEQSTLEEGLISEQRLALDIVNAPNTMDVPTGESTGDFSTKAGMSFDVLNAPVPSCSLALLEELPLHKPSNLSQVVCEEQSPSLSQGKRQSSETDELVISTQSPMLISSPNQLIVFSHILSWLCQTFQDGSLVSRRRHVPMQCTDRNAALRSVKRSTVYYFHRFEDLWYYKLDPMKFVYYTTEGVFSINFRRMRRLSSGGNGTVYCGGPEDRYAIKETDYKKEELNISHKFNHPNVMSLLGVVVNVSSTQPNKCYQIMEKMTCDLRKALCVFGPHGLLKCLWEIDATQQLCFLKNTAYILQCIVSGLMYLKSLGIEHGDLKEQNILLLWKCNCPHIFSCECPVDDPAKYAVKLADFDSVSDFMTGRNCLGCGTITYRAPEKGVHRSNGVDCGGTYSDIWSLGVILLYMLMGHGSHQEILQEVGILMRQPHCTLNARSEAVYVEQLFFKLFRIVNKPSLPVLNHNKECLADMDHAEAYKPPIHNHDKKVYMLVTIIRRCLVIDHTKRASPEELQQLLEELQQLLQAA